MDTTLQHHEEHSWTVAGLIVSFLIGVAVIGLIWLFTGLLIGLFFI